jgi:transketolase
MSQNAGREAAYTAALNVLALTKKQLGSLNQGRRRMTLTYPAMEQGSTLGWERYVGDSGRVIGMQTFGASAPLKELQRKFGFEPDRVVASAMEQLGRK